MSEFAYEISESIKDDQEKELFIDKDIFDLVKDFFETDSNTKDYRFADSDSHEKSFETSHTNSTQDCLLRNEIKKKFKLSTILKENILFSARKLKLRLIEKMTDVNKGKIVNKKIGLVTHPNFAKKSKFYFKLGYNSYENYLDD